MLYRRTTGGVSQMVVQFGDQSDTFSISGSTFTSTKANGATLVIEGIGYTYRAADGTRVSYSAAGPDLGYPWTGPGCNLGDPGTCALPMSVTRPDSTAFALNWDVLERCHQYDSELNCLNSAAYFRFRGVTSSTNYGFSFSYVTNSPLNQGAPQSDWYKRTGASFTNSLTAPSPLPTVTYTQVATGVEDVTDTGGRTWRITSSSGLITGVRRPGSSANNISVSYGSGGIVSSITRDGVTTSYSRSVSSNIATTTVTNALSQQTIVVADLNLERVTSVKDPLNRTTSFSYDAHSRPMRTTAPEGNYVQLSYDARGNVTQTQAVPKPSVGGATITTLASYPSSCTTPSCNQPTSTTDARGAVTDYAYDGHDRLIRTNLPVHSKGAQTSSGSDYEELGYDSGFNVTSRRLRDGQVIGYSYDNLGRLTFKNLPGSEPDVSYAHDNLGRITSANQSGNAHSFSYDALSRNLTQSGPLGTTSYAYDVAGRRTRLAWSDGFYVDYHRLVTGEMPPRHAAEISQGS